MKRGHSHHQGPHSPPATQADLARLGRYIRIQLWLIWLRLRVLGLPDPETKAKANAVLRAALKQHEEIAAAIKTGAPNPPNIP